ncbi:MAG: OPT/YSL family transporter [Polyangiaceae bacterium]|nr:OPT/YSL family transporter [Polyangiaceae bacterium]
MAIETLTPEQIRDWPREKKDAWWLERVYRGDMPQLTLRSAVTGFLLGGILSATNLSVGAKTGWTLGVGLTSVILAYAAFRVMARAGASDMTILENNCSQSIATAAGYMTGPLVSGMAAYMWIQNALMPWWQMMLFNVTLSLLGVLVAFPMKRRFINEEQQPFPEGAACGVVLDALYSTAAASGMYKAKVLVRAGGLAAALGALSGESVMKLVQVKWLGLKEAWHFPHSLDAWYYELAKKGLVPVPRLAGVPIRELGVSPALDLAMVGAGGLMGMRTAGSMLVGMVLNFLVLVPAMIAAGEIRPRADGTFSRVHVVNTWSLWWGIAIMVVASMVSLFAKPEVFVAAFRALRGRGERAADVLGHIELPLKVSLVGAPLVGAVGVWMAHAWFGVPLLWGALSLPMIFVLTLIATSSTALTSITPTGSLSKIPQFTFGALDPRHPPTNLMTGVMCVEVASNASNLLMDIKPGYMLGAKPRQQAIGHVIGVVAGALASTPLFYVLFLSDWAPGRSVQEAMAPEGGQFGFPSALQWQGVSNLVTAIFGGGGGTLLTRSIVTSMLVAAVAGLVLEVARIRSHGRLPLSPLAVGLGVVVPPESTIAMFAGAAFFHWMERRHAGHAGTPGYERWVGGKEPICAGLIAGAALLGIADILVKVFWL